MLTIPNDKIKEVMQEVIDTILIPHFTQLGMNASGEWLRSLEARAENERGEIWGRDYTRYLVNGRAPGNLPNIGKLIEWVGYKWNLYGEEGRSAAFAVAKKIAKEGTEYYPSGTDLLEILQSPTTQQYVYTKMGIFMNGQIESQIKRMLTETFA